MSMVFREPGFGKTCPPAAKLKNPMPEISVSVLGSAFLKNPGGDPFLGYSLNVNMV